MSLFFSLGCCFISDQKYFCPFFPFSFVRVRCSSGVCVSSRLYINECMPAAALWRSLSGSACWFFFLHRPQDISQLIWTYVRNIPVHISNGIFLYLAHRSRLNWSSDTYEMSAQFSTAQNNRSSTHKIEFKNALLLAVIDSRYCDVHKKGKRPTERRRR